MIFQTEVQRLQHQLAEASAELRRRDRAEVEAKIAARKAAEQAVIDEADAATAKATAEQIEKNRRAAWVNHSTEEALKNGDAAFANYLMGDMTRHVPADPTAWPPGVEPDAFPVLGVAEPVDISGTLIGRAIAKAGGLRM